MLGINLTRKVQNLYKEKETRKGPKVTLNDGKQHIWR